MRCGWGLSAWLEEAPRCQPNDQGCSASQLPSESAQTGHGQSSIPDSQTPSGLFRSQDHKRQFLVFSNVCWLLQSPGPTALRALDGEVGTI